MSFLSVTPDAVTSAAGNLEILGSSLNSANVAAATGTTGMAAMASDEVSAAVQSAFVTYAQGYQAVSAKAAAFHASLVSTLNDSSLAYLSTEIANAQQTLGTEIYAAQEVVGADAAAVAQAMKDDAVAALRVARTDAVVAEGNLARVRFGFRGMFRRP